MESIWARFDFDAAIESLIFNINDKVIGTKKGYLLFSFELPFDIDFHEIKIKRTVRVNQISRFHSFICEVTIPNWILWQQDQFLNVLSAALTMCFSKLIRPAFDYDMYPIETADQQRKVGIQLIVEMHAGHITPEELAIGKERFISLINYLNTIDTKDYRIIMQSIRLIYLNFHARILDINLAYTLLVGSIENLASSYINRKDPSIKKESLELSDDDMKIKELCEQNNLSSWFNENILHHKKLKAKFVEFIIRYAPFPKWFEIKERYPEPTKPPVGYEHLFDKARFTKEYIKASRIQQGNYHPDELNIEDIRKLLGDTYNHRSRFIHNGIGLSLEKESSNRFFDWITDFKKNNRFLTINYSCLLLISKVVIFELILELKSNQKTVAAISK